MNSHRSAILIAATLITFGFLAQVNAESSLFTDVTESQFPSLPQGIGETFADIDNDGDLDIIDTSAGFVGIHCCLNDGLGNFVLAPNNAGLPTNGEGHSAIVGDLDNDGDLDLAIGWYWIGGSKVYENSEGTFSDISSSCGVGNPGNIHGGAFADVDQDSDLDLSFAVNGPNKLYINDGSGHFSEQASSRGIAVGGYGITTMFCDLDSDGDLDLITTSSSTGYSLFMNDGTGHFADATDGSGIRQLRANCVTLGDIDNDGDMDLFQGGSGGVYLNNGLGQFTDITATCGVTPGYANSALWIDANNDGYLDLWETGKLWLNNGDTTFTDSTSGSGLESVGDPDKSVTFGDIDGDGDLDMRTSTALFRNNTEHSKYLIVHPLNRFGSTAYNAKVWVYKNGRMGDASHLLGYTEVIGSTTRDCGPVPYAHFGLEQSSRVDVRVWFLNGAVREIRGVKSNQKIIVREPELPKRIIYVKEDSAPPCNGTSWKNAFQSVQNALAVANEGDQIWVAQGTYLPTTTNNRSLSFQLKSGVNLYGGFSGKERLLKQRDFVANQTILSGDIGTSDTMGDNSYHVVRGADEAILDGFIITQGNANLDGGHDARGGGLYDDGTSTTIINCTFMENYAIYGGGIENREGGTPNILSCTFMNNTARKGAGILNSRTNPIIDGCVFANNASTEQGGGIHNNGGATPTIKHCLFFSNTAGNEAGAIMNEDSAVSQIDHCTFTGNASKRGGAMFNYYTAPVITNSIFWADTASNAQNEIYNQGVTPSVTYTCIMGGYDGVGNIDTDPLFVDPAGQNFHLKSVSGHWTEKRWGKDETTSPCVDAGNPVDDFGQEPMPNGFRVNMGAYGNTSQASRSHRCELIINSNPINGVAIEGFDSGVTPFTSVAAKGQLITLLAPLNVTDYSDEYEFVQWKINGKKQPTGQTELSFIILAKTEVTAEYRLVSELSTPEDLLPKSKHRRAHQH